MGPWGEEVFTVSWEYPLITAAAKHNENKTRLKDELNIGPPGRLGLGINVHPDECIHTDKTLSIPFL
jgi:hypothetical protein